MRRALAVATVGVLTLVSLSGCFLVVWGG